MKAEIVSIGTELLLGTITDTNASFLAQRLAALGIDCFYVSQVGDNQDRIVETLRRATERSDLTITTGGLGPTGDDLTRESLASLLNEVPAVKPELEANLRAFFRNRGVEMPQRNLKQATVIPSARILQNPIGTAPGWLTAVRSASSERHIVSMPGVPYEMKRMWAQEVEPWLRPLCPSVLVSRTLKTLGVGESAVDEIAGELMDGTNPTLAPYAKSDGVYLRITAKARTEAEAYRLIGPVEQLLRERLGDAVYGADNEAPADVIRGLLGEAGLTISVIEIGAGAVGAVSSQLAGYTGLAGSVAGRSARDAATLLGAPGGNISLQTLCSALRDKSAADLVLGLQVDEIRAEADASIRAHASLLLVTSPVAGDGHLPVTHTSWKTSEGEVPRLAGLAALNMLRRWLLAQRKEHPIHAAK